jgi:hypothetical protein
VCCLQRVQGDIPFVNKNVKHMLRIGALMEIFPNARFLIVKRNAEDVALSILRGRREERIREADWWSVRPPNYEDIKDLEVPRRVASQVVALSERLDQDVAGMPIGQVNTIDYESFCRDPESLTAILQATLAPVALRNSPVTSFAMRRNRPHDQDEHETLAELARLRAVASPGLGRPATRGA